MASDHRVHLGHAGGTDEDGAQSPLLDEQLAMAALAAAPSPAS